MSYCLGKYIDIGGSGGFSCDVIFISCLSIVSTNKRFFISGNAIVIHLTIGLIRFVLIICLLSNVYLCCRD